MSVVTININADLSAMEQKMSDIEAGFEDLKATVAAEKAEVAEAVAALTAKIDELSAFVAAGEANKDFTVAKLAELKADVAGIYSKPVETPVDPSGE